MLRNTELMTVDEQNVMEKRSKRQLSLFVWYYSVESDNVPGEYLHIRISLNYLAMYNFVY